MVVYAKGCLTCGRIGRQLNRLLKYCNENGLDLTIKISDSDEDNQKEHLMALHKAGLPTATYTAIVVDDNGKVTRLAQWNLSS